VRHHGARTVRRHGARAVYSSEPCALPRVRRTSGCKMRRPCSWHRGRHGGRWLCGPYRSAFRCCSHCFLFRRLEPAAPRFGQVQLRLLQRASRVSDRSAIIPRPATCTSQRLSALPTPIIGSMPSFEEFCWEPCTIRAVIQVAGRGVRARPARGRRVPQAVCLPMGHHVP